MVLTLLLGCQNNTNTIVQEGFVEPDPTQWVEYSKPVREYMYYRTQAVVDNDINVLWNRYPALKEQVDNQKGINVEKFEVGSINEGFKLIDANFDMESYEPIKVDVKSEDEVVVLVHGSIVYVRDDFEESGGEYLIELNLQRTDSQWTVVKTDEYTLSEYKEWMKEKK